MSDHTDNSPKHRRPFAAALQWDADRGGAPTVTAKGDGALAEQILRVAFDRGVKVRTDADLAEVLRASELDREIPYAAFVAVAEILAHLYQANGAYAPGPADTDDADAPKRASDADEDPA